MHKLMDAILTAELQGLRERLAKPALDILETGCIRNSAEEYRTGDGWSTLTFARHVAEHGGSSTSIDLDTSSADQILTREGVRSHAALITGDSVTTLLALADQGATYDLVLLDSADDPTLIFNEYRITEPLVRVGGLLMVDDVKLHNDSYGSKGDAIVPRLKQEGIPFRFDRRWGGGGYIDVIMIDKKCHESGGHTRLE
ncbi:class I SAM-dependent methyltransferase [Streptomyces olivoreticuli]